MLQPASAPDHRAWDNLRECERCGLISALPERNPARVATCPRCHNALWRMREHRFEFIIACGLAGAVFYCFALIAPFLEISALGRTQLAALDSGPKELLQQGFGPLGLLVLGASAIFPGIKLFIALITLIGIKTRALPARLLKSLFRWYRPITPWAMIDVYLLGFLVAYTKMVALAEIHLDASLYSLIGLMFIFAAMDGALDPEAVWRALDMAEKNPRRSAPETSPQTSIPIVSMRGLIGCHCCGLVSSASAGERCQRCNSVLHHTKKDSVARSWAFLIAAAVLYIPSNLDPIMIYTQLGVSTPYTIMTGIVDLLQSGLWPLALLVFFASITIPLSKLIAMSYLLISTQFRSTKNLLAKTRIFAAVEFIGRWSMIDVFMISILVALLRFEEFTNVRADTGILCFAGVVVLTMFAVDGFDPKLMWAALDAPRSQSASQKLAPNRGEA